MNHPDLAPIVEAKRQLRAVLRASLKGQVPAEREAGSARLCQRLLEAPAFLAGGPLLGFVALPSEPDLRPALEAAARAGRVVAFPQWDTDAGTYVAAVWQPGQTFGIGPWGVPEPPPGTPVLPMARLDLVLVPGLAFDCQGRRLGRGKGHFDRLLACAKSAQRWGIAFDFQVVREVPAEAHDVNVDLLATPSQWIPVPRGRLA